MSQYTTEQVLEKKAEERGIKVERLYRLAGLSDSEDESIVATFDNGERIKAKYVIGADGSHSVVRQLVNLGFADPDGASIDDKDVRQMVLADVSFSPPPTHLTRDQVSRYTSKTNFYLYRDHDIRRRTIQPRIAYTGLNLTYPGRTVHHLRLPPRLIFRNIWIKSCPSFCTQEREKRVS